MTVPVVHAIVLLRLSELIHDFACFGVLAMFRNVERLRVSFVGDDFRDLNCAIVFVFCGYLNRKHPMSDELGSNVVQ